MFGVGMVYGVATGTILTPPVRKNHRKATYKMYPSLPLVQRQRQGRIFTDIRCRAEERKERDCCTACGVVTISFLKLNSEYWIKVLNFY